VLESVEITVGKTVYTYPEEFFSLSVAGIPAQLAGPFVWIGFSQDVDASKLASMAVSGKIAIALEGSAGKEEADRSERRQKRRELLAYLEAAGAKALLVLMDEEEFQGYSRFAGRSSMAVVNESESGFPMFYVSPQMGEAILRSAKTSESKVRAEMTATGSIPDIDFGRMKWSYEAKVTQSSVYPTNVMGYLEGTDKKDEVIIFTAHYDHEGVNAKGEIFNGADDDGSGTTTILELAEAFVQATEAGYRPRRSLVFMAVSGEEKGLLGSGYYADHPVFPISQTVANLNIDMIGRIDRFYEGREDSANYTYVIGAGRLSTELREINEHMNGEFAHLTLDYKYDDPKDPNRFYERSDHYNFAKKGIPIIFYFTGVHKDYHRPTDTVEKINFDKMARIAKLIFATGWELANRDERIVVDHPTEEGN
jgi:hypothetical protein